MLLNTISFLQTADRELHCMSLSAMSTCYFGSLMIPSAWGIGLVVMGVNPVTSAGAERLRLDLAAHFVLPLLFSQAAP